MRWWCDAFGFPFVFVDSLDVCVSLFPITNVQFERFAAEPNGYGDAWYEEVLRVSPRQSWRRTNDESLEGLMMTGITAAEALAYSVWAGPDYDLPTVHEWRNIYRWMKDASVTEAELSSLRDRKIHPAALPMLDTTTRDGNPMTMAELSLMTGGIIEWVRDGSLFKGLGKPRARFLSNTFNLLRDDPVLPRGSRSPYFGLRPIRRTKKG